MTFNVVAHSHYQGSLGGDWHRDLHICVDHLVDQSVQVWFRTNALTGAIERAAQCVAAKLVLHGQACQPEAYIASWRYALQQQDAYTLESFFQDFDVSLQVCLPLPGAQHQHWLSPEFKQARERLFGAQCGQSTTVIACAADIVQAMKVLAGVTAYGLIPRSLTDCVTVTPRVAAVQLAVA